jgi:hypothetical protein
MKSFFKVVTLTILLFLTSCGGEPPSLANVSIEPNPSIQYRYYVNKDGSWFDQYWAKLKFSNDGNSSALVQFNYFYTIDDEIVSSSSSSISVTIPENDSEWELPPSHYLEVDSFTKINGRLINISDIRLSFYIYNVYPIS